jgi:hypothetical protein
MKRCFSIMFMLALMATAASAQSAADLKAFEGTWKCTGVAFASEMAPEHATTATVTGRWIMGGKWMDVHYTEMKTAKNPHPVEAEILMSYDHGAKKLVAGSIDNGGGYSTQESSGWSSDMLTLAGPYNMGGAKMNYRDVFTRKGANTMLHTGEAEMNGSWKKIDEQTCKK